MKRVFLYVVYKWKSEILSFFVTLNIVRNLYTFTHVLQILHVGQDGNMSRE